MIRTSHIISGIVGALATAVILYPTTLTPSSSTDAMNNAMVDSAESTTQTLAATAHSTQLERPQRRTEVAQPNPQRTIPEAPATDPNWPMLISPEMAELCIAVAKDLDPDLGRRLEMLREHDERRFQMLVRAEGRRLLAMAELRSRDTTLYSLKIQEMNMDSRVMMLARDLREAVLRADETAIAALETELEMVLNMQFAFMLGARGHYLLRLEHHVEELRAEIDDMAMNREKLIAERLEELKCSDRPVQPSWQRESTTDSFVHADEFALPAAPAQP